ncbi:MAG: S-methyl-5'-thioinosine phosphorylase [Gammaproteobacteria bacterium]
MTMVKLAIIGGTGLTSLEGLEVTGRQVVPTPYGEPSGPITHGALFGKPVSFLARHGYSHTIPPHMVNYRANMWALKHVGADHIVAFAAVGGISGDIPPGRLIILDQIIDYTWSRGHTFFESDLDEVIHIDFTNPYCEALRELLVEAARDVELDVREQGTYGATQGPRLETAAEIGRLARDGCDVVGMTGMPEAALARELGLCYAACAICTNWAAGVHGSEISMDDIRKTLNANRSKAERLLTALMKIVQ